jgi:uncharacterized membrane protein
MSQHLYLPVMLMIAGFGFFVLHSRRRARQGEIRQSYWVVGTGLTLVVLGAVLLGVFLSHAR